MTASRAELHRWLAGLPLIAILRGLRPDEAAAVGSGLMEAGFRALEVPLNSPRPYDSIAILAGRFGAEALIGAGTVLDAKDVTRVRDSGGRLIVLPHAEVAVIAEAKRHGMLCLPGAATPTEGFAALAAGADALKLFPAEMLSPAILKAWRAVFPAEAWLLPVGGITPERMASYWAAGADGFGIGAALFKPGMTPAEIARQARAFTTAFSALPARV